MTKNELINMYQQALLDHNEKEELYIAIRFLIDSSRNCHNYGSIEYRECTAASCDGIATLGYNRIVRDHGSQKILIVPDLKDFRYITSNLVKAIMPSYRQHLRRRLLKKKKYRRKLKDYLDISLGWLKSGSPISKRVLAYSEKLSGLAKD
ncbi:hypothetical protein CR513_35985, partial [Mucuna pruriens]